MKNAFKTVIAAILVLIAVSPLRTQAAVSVYAEDALTNSAAGTAESTSTVSGAKVDHLPVRIDDTGVHVGGPNPVDINVPSIKSHQTRGIDVVGLVAVVFGCSIPIIVVSLSFYYGHRRSQMVHETVRGMVDKGLPVTPELVAGLTGKDAKAARPRNDLRRGLILVGVGAGLIMLVGKPGWIVFFIGLAFLAISLMERNNQDGGQPPR